MSDHDEHTWESEMGEVFERRVRGLHEAPFDLGAVKGRATTIRRRRRAAVAGGILAAAAVVVPVAALTGAGLGDRADDLAPAGPSVTVTDPSTPDPEQSEGFAYLEVGSGAAVLHADGSTSTLPGPRYTDAASLGDVVAAYRPAPNNGTTGQVDLVEDGEVTTTYDVRSPMATAPDGRTVAFVTADDELVFVDAEVGEQSLGTVEDGVTLSAIVGDGDCALESGCHPFLEYLNFEEGDAFEINYEGGATAPAPGAVRVNDADDDFLVSVVTSAGFTDTQTCGGLYDREDGGAWVFETCDYQVRDISPDGAHTIGLPSYFDGLGAGIVYLLDDRGEEVASIDALVGDTTWADDDTAVVTVFRDGRWQIVSWGVDGSEEVLVEGAPGDETSSPYRLTGQS